MLSHNNESAQSPAELDAFVQHLWYLSCHVAQDAFTMSESLCEPRFHYITLHAPTPLCFQENFVSYIYLLTHNVCV